MRLKNCFNQTLEVDGSQFHELLEMGAIDHIGEWLEDPIEDFFLPCWTFLAIGLDQVPGEITMNLELDRRVLN